MDARQQSNRWRLTAVSVGTLLLGIASLILVAVGSRWFALAPIVFGLVIPWALGAIGATCAALVRNFRLVVANTLLILVYPGSLLLAAYVLEPLRFYE